MSKQVFRKEALERLSSPEQLDQLMPITSPFGWIALSGVGLVLLMAVSWAFLGTITKTVEGRGALVRLGGVTPVEATCAGTVTEILVGIGDPVKEGQPLVRLEPAPSGGEGRAETVRSPGAGRILDIAAVAGEPVEEYSVVATVESPERPLVAVVYVAAGDGYKVQANNQAQVVPATAQEGESVYLRGAVKSAGRFPASRDAMMRTLQNDYWVESLVALGPALQIVIGFDGRDSPREIYSGVPCRALITVDEKPPIEFMFPIFGNR